jgi:hypothetical protein
MNFPSGLTGGISSSPLLRNVAGLVAPQNQTNNVKYEQKLTFNISGDADPAEIERATGDAIKSFHDKNNRATKRAIDPGYN